MYRHAVLTSWFPWVHVRVHYATRSHRVSWAHVRLPRTKNFKKNFHKKTVKSQYPWLGKPKRLTMSKGFGTYMVNQCAVLWCGRDLWVETAHSHLPYFALCRKTTPNKQRAAKPYNMAMNWAQVSQTKQLQAQVRESTIYIYFHTYISTF